MSTAAERTITRLVKSKPYKQEMERIMQTKELVRHAKGHKLKIKLRTHPQAGRFVVATANIKKGSIVAYYQGMVFPERLKGFDNSSYRFELPTAGGGFSRKYLIDIYLGSFPSPVRGVPFWGPFMNEPTLEKSENIEPRYNLPRNYRNKDAKKAGDIYIIDMVAIKNIKKGEAVTWCYGEEYGRKYKACGEE